MEIYQTEIEAKLQHDGNETKLWCKQNKMEIDYDKTTCMIVGTQQRTKNIQPLNVNIDGNTIRDVKNRNNWVYTSTKIFAGHTILTIFVPLSHPIFHYLDILSHISRYMLKMFYQGYILQLIEYGSRTWVTTSKSYIEGLSKLHKRAARIILNEPYDTASSEKFKTIGWPSIQK